MFLIFARNFLFLKYSSTYLISYFQQITPIAKSITSALVSKNAVNAYAKLSCTLSGMNKSKYPPIKRYNSRVEAITNMLNAKIYLVLLKNINKKNNNISVTRKITYPNSRSTLLNSVIRNARKKAHIKETNVFSSILF